VVPILLFGGIQAIPPILNTFRLRVAWSFVCLSHFHAPVWGSKHQLKQFCTFNCKLQPCAATWRIQMSDYALWHVTFRISLMCIAQVYYHGSR